MAIAVAEGRKTRPKMEIGICGSTVVTPIRSTCVTSLA